MSIRTTFAAIAATVALAGATLPAIAGPADEITRTDIRREGSAARRTTLNAMELKPFDHAAATGLNDWHNGSAPAAEDVMGKPVLIVTWSSWYRPTHAAMRTAQRMYEQYADQGLLVIGVHDNRGYEGAEEAAGKLGVTFPYAKDNNGALRAALKVDQDPDFYVIDRAGNVRFADIEIASVADAVKAVVEESAEDAAAVPANLARALRAADFDVSRTRTNLNPVKPGERYKVNFEMPSPEAYEAAKWPEVNPNSGIFIEKDKTVSLASETWLTERPDMRGRVVVIDFWATWCIPCQRVMPKLDQLATDHLHDVVFVGISGFGSDQNNVDQVKSYIRAHKSEMAKAHDDSQRLFMDMFLQGLPTALIISTDGKIRWAGHPADPAFDAALQRVISRDPGVKARRDAEKKFLESIGQG